MSSVFRLCAAGSAIDKATADRTMKARISVLLLTGRSRDLRDIAVGIPARRTDAILGGARSAVNRIDRGSRSRPGEDAELQDGVPVASGAARAKLPLDQ